MNVTSRFYEEDMKKVRKSLREADKALEKRKISDTKFWIKHAISLLKEIVNE
jgi:hypothetical protein